MSHCLGMLLNLKNPEGVDGIDYQDIILFCQKNYNRAFFFIFLFYLISLVII